jgi:hypothetical protein
MKDGALRGPSGEGVRAPRKAAPEDDAGRFGENLDMLAKRCAADEFERRRLSGTRSTGEHDTARHMRVGTVAADHGCLALHGHSDRANEICVKVAAPDGFTRCGEGQWGIVRSCLVLLPAGDRTPIEVAKV